MTTTETRLTALEAEVARLREKIEGERAGVIGRTQPHFLDVFSGLFAQRPLFEKMTRDVERQRRQERAQSNDHPAE